MKKNSIENIALMAYFPCLVFIYFIFEKKVFDAEPIDDSFVFIRNIFYMVYFIYSCSYLYIRRNERSNKVFVGVFILASSFSVIFFHNTLSVFDMKLKAVFFYQNKKLCPSMMKNNNTMVCYDYVVNMTGGERYRLVFDEYGEMSRPPEQWSITLQKSLFPNGVFEANDCSINNRRLIFKNLYLISDSCWKNS